MDLQPVACGGIFSGQLDCENTKLLIIAIPTGEKYKYACEWKLPCVLPSWVHESVRDGYAVSVEPHRTPHKEVVKCSTPNSDDTRFLPDFSMVSTIAGGSATHVNETVADTTIQSFLTKKNDVNKNPQTRHSGASRYSEILVQLDLREAKNAGLFLDGCNVYLSGFNMEQTEKLRRVLNGGGATRFNEISDSVTHIIVGDIVSSDLKFLKSSGFRPYVVTVDWVIESMKLRSPAHEEEFLCTDILLQPAEPPSPLSKKGLQLLRKPTDRPFPSFELTNDVKTTRQRVEKTLLPLPTDLVDQYLHTSVSENDSCKDLEGGSKNKQLAANTKPSPLNETEERPEEKQFDSFNKDVAAPHNSRAEPDTMPSTETTNVLFFTDLTFFVVGFDNEETELLKDVIESHGGIVVDSSFKGIADYAVVPLSGAELSQTATEIVTYIWIEDCLLREELVPMMYYHHPVPVDLCKRPLVDCVMGISSYVGKERDFIFAVSEMLGAITQELFARKNHTKKNALASTHLICSEPGSQKYRAAVKWQLPAVNHEWLLACAKEGKRVSEKPYLVGESSCHEIDTLRISEATKTDNSLTGQNGTPNLKVQSSLLSADEPQNIPTDMQTPNSELRPRNKRVVELQSDAVMGPPSPPTEQKGSCLREHLLTTPHTNKHGFSQESPLHIPTIEASTPKNGANCPGGTNQQTPKGPFSVSTPQTPYGQILKPNPSPETRKNWKKWIDNFPDFQKKKISPKRKRKLSTPLSELKRRCWDMILPKDKPPVHSGVLDSEMCSDSAVNPVVSKSASGKVTSDSPSALSQKLDGEASRSQGSDPVPSSGIHTQLAQLNQLLSRRQSEGSDSEPRIRRVRSSEAHIQEDHSDHNKRTDPEIEHLKKESQGLVGWDDPIDVNEQKRKSDCSQQGYRFMLSGIVDRDHYESIILSLGGEVTDKPAFDPTATHLVCSRPVRNEKLLASIASGKWVLHKGYLDASEKENCFIQEDEFEWGNPSALSVMRDLKPKSLEYELALSVHRWRCTLTEDTTGAFMGMRAIVRISREREEPFKRLILAGGGRLVDFSNLDEATHCFVELNKVSLPIDLAVLVKKRIPCVAPVYLNDYLIITPPPQAHDCVVPEYKHLLECL